MSKPGPEFVLAVFCDLLKALDVINHDILLKKMTNYGIRGIANDWFENYPSDRQQYVEVGGKIFDTVPIIIRVPRGSILGPLLYLIYVNGNCARGIFYLLLTTQHCIRQIQILTNYMKMLMCKSMIYTNGSALINYL